MRTLAVALTIADRNNPIVSHLVHFIRQSSFLMVSEDIIYSCLKLDEENLIALLKGKYMRSPYPQIHRIKEITYSGHEFLDAIRPASNWQKIKETSNKAGMCTMKALKDIAIEIAKTAILLTLQSGQ